MVVVAEGALSATPQSILGTSFSALTNVTVATFTDTDPLGAAGNFSAQITWGDGTDSQAAVSASGGAFNVVGSHTYVNAGVYGVSACVVDVAGSSVTADSTATITGSVTLQAADVSGNAGVALSPVTVGTFTASSGSPFTASIDWGDGNITAGSVTIGSGVYTVTGSNTYGADFSAVTVGVLTSSDVRIASIQRPRK
jgi:hypothetical protein